MKRKGILIGLGPVSKGMGDDEDEGEGDEYSEDEGSSSLAAFKDVADLIKDDTSSADEIAQALKDAVDVCMNEYDEEE